MTKRCKHLNGQLMELQEDMHIRQVRDGFAEKEGLNEYGMIVGYAYRCYDCKKDFRFVDATKTPKWLEQIYNQL